MAFLDDNVVNDIISPRAVSSEYDSKLICIRIRRVCTGGGLTCFVLTVFRTSRTIYHMTGEFRNLPVQSRTVLRKTICTFGSLE